MTKPLALIIEDHENIATVYQDALTIGGFDTHAIYDGRTALEALESAQPDLIVLDMNLPHVSGHYIFKQIRASEAYDHVPIIIATANAMVADALAQELGPRDVLMIKPVSVEEMTQVAIDLLS